MRSSLSVLMTILVMTSMLFIPVSKQELQVPSGAPPRATISLSQPPHLAPEKPERSQSEPEPAQENGSTSVQEMSGKQAKEEKPVSKEKQTLFSQLAENVESSLPSLTDPVQRTKREMISVEKSAKEDSLRGYYTLEEVTEAPRFDRTVLASRIIYPELARRQGKEGLVVLRLFVSETGSVEEVEVIKDPGYGFAQAAVEAFRFISGSPAVMQGRAVPVMLRYPVRFSLN